MREPVVERYRIEKKNCVYVVTVHQEWFRQIDDVEVVYDLAWKPLRAWKRMTIPGVDEEDGRADTRLYELRNDPPTMSRRAHGELEHRVFQGRDVEAGEVVAVVGPGRALLNAWIQKADLEVGEVVRGPVLDFRELVERVDEVALRRDPDRMEETLGRRVRVYTVFGRESVFADDEGWIIGDLAGLRDDRDLDTEPPPALPTYGAPDPVGTP
ncbi:MAG: hypothetical protein AAGH15_27945 [Myxococcota bacterium]